MKKFFLISAIILAFQACNDRNNEPDCNCTKQRFERSTIRSTEWGSPIISSTPWVKTGFPEQYGNDCKKNGLQIEFGSTGSFFIPPDKYGVTEYYYAVECR